MAVAEAKNDKDIDLFSVRSVLFLPASNSRAIAKARETEADLVVLDLEDAVKPADKSAARKAAGDAAETDWRMPLAIRVNGVGIGDFRRADDAGDLQVAVGTFGWANADRFVGEADVQ